MELRHNRWSIVTAVAVKPRTRDQRHHACLRVDSVHAPKPRIRNEQVARPVKRYVTWEHECINCCNHVSVPRNNHIPPTSYRSDNPRQSVHPANSSVLRVSNKNVPKFVDRDSPRIIESGIPSPLKPEESEPATVVITLETASIRLTRLFPESETKMFPA
jgi:hypothetical protein